MKIEARFHIERRDFLLDVDLAVPGESVTALLGPSGCGKTTLLRAIAGLEKHPGGFLKVGERIWQDDRIFIPPHERLIGYVFQEASLFSFLSVKGNLEYGLKRVSKSENAVSLDQAIELLGIGHLLTRRPDTLSGGEQQRVAIARALAVSPRLLLLDEPLASLDMTRKKEILPYLESLHQELDIPIIYVSHAPDEVARLADTVVLMDYGRIVGVGGVFDIFTRLDLPLAHLPGAETIIDATVSAHDDTYELTYLDFPGGRFSVSRQELTQGDKARLRVLARDVSLTLEHQSGTSILNIFPAVVDELIPEGKSQVTVRLLAGGAPLLSRVTKKSADLLDLHPGKAVYAQAKSVALLS